MPTVLELPERRMRWYSLLRLTNDTHDPVSPDRARIDFDGLTSDSVV
jgi:hypothetical protein